MLHITSTKVAALIGSAVAAGVAFAPLASAEPCQSTGGATLCQSNGSASMSATPPIPAGSGNDQNGSYGPSGNTPPVGN